MFIRYDYILPFSENPNSFKKWKYKIIDNDFIEEGTEYGVGIWYSCINTYEKRNLPVVPNLIRVFRWYTNYLTKHGLNYDINYAMGACRMHEPKFSKYENEVKKYLLLV
jgi:hypothetical protein